MNNPKISIVILNYNGQEYIEQVVRRVVALNYDNKEVVIVDNNSKDNSVKILEKIDNIKIIINNKNFGYSEGKNIGVSHAHGEYILLMDNDILISDINILSKLLNAYNNKINLAFICPVLLEKNKDTTIYWQNSIGITGVRRPRPIRNEKLLSADEQVYESNMIFGGNLFFSKDIWDILGGFDPILPFNMDDYDISLRAQIMGYQSYNMLNKPINTHIGSEKRNDTGYYIWSFRYLLAGHLLANLKNLSWFYFLVISFFESIRLLLEAFKQSLLRKEIKIIGVYFYSIIIFLKKTPQALKGRKTIQKKRKKDDIAVILLKNKYNF